MNKKVEKFLDMHFNQIMMSLWLFWAGFDVGRGIYKPGSTWVIALFPLLMATIYFLRIVKPITKDE